VYLCSLNPLNVANSFGMSMEGMEGSRTLLCGRFLRGRTLNTRWDALLNGASEDWHSGELLS